MLIKVLLNLMRARKTDAAVYKGPYDHGPLKQRECMITSVKTNQPKLGPKQDNCIEFAGDALEMCPDSDKHKKQKFVNRPTTVKPRQGIRHLPSRTFICRDSIALACKCATYPIIFRYDSRHRPDTPVFA